VLGRLISVSETAPAPRPDAYPLRVDHGEMVQRVPFPFADGSFPSELGAVVQVSVLTGEQPAREVVHTSDGSWAVADRVGDPNLPGASVATHISHAVQRDPAIAELATMPPGHLAHRSGPDAPWSIDVFAGWEDGHERTPVGSWAWLLAGGPLVVAAAMVWYLVTWTGPSARVLVVLAAVLVVVIASAVATRRDIGLLAGRGLRVSRIWVLAVLLLYPLAAPAYLIHRTRKAQNTAFLPVAWLLSVVLLYLSPGFAGQ
jgi:hypothetical protein